MRRQYHILNGDSLKEQFPESLQGEIIVARECLVDGNIEGDSLNTFFRARARFISSNYDGYDEQDYFKKSVPEFQKMQNIPGNADINLWFEDDLFCQVNFWFVINLLAKSNRNDHVFLVRPKTHDQFGFGGLNQSELISIYETRQRITEIPLLTRLWEFYQINDLDELTKTAGQLKNSYPFIFTAVEAHIERIPSKGNMGRPMQSLLQIMEELNTVEFGPIFKEFGRREAIYGYGDLQVKRLLNEIIKNQDQI